MVISGETDWSCQSTDLDSLVLGREDHGIHWRGSYVKAACHGLSGPGLPSSFDPSKNTNVRHRWVSLTAGHYQIEILSF